MGVETSGVELSGVEMSTFGIKIGHFNPHLYNKIYCVIPGVEMSPTPSGYRNQFFFTDVTPSLCQQSREQIEIETKYS